MAARRWIAFLAVSFVLVASASAQEAKKKPLARASPGDTPDLVKSPPVQLPNALLYNPLRQRRTFHGVIKSPTPIRRQS
jgi:hypothetical protein